MERLCILTDCRPGEKGATGPQEPYLTSRRGCTWGDDPTPREVTGQSRKTATRWEFEPETER